MLSLGQIKSQGFQGSSSAAVASPSFFPAPRSALESLGVSLILRLDLNFEEEKVGLSLFGMKNWCNVVMLDMMEQITCKIHNGDDVINIAPCHMI